MKCVTAGFSFLAAFFLNVSCCLNSSWQAGITSVSSYGGSVLVHSFVWIFHLSDLPQCPSSPSASPPWGCLGPGLFNGKSSSSFCSSFSCVLALEIVFIFKIVSSNERKFSWAILVVMAQLCLCFSPLCFGYVKLLKPNALQAGYR